MPVKIGLIHNFFCNSNRFLFLVTTIISGIILNVSLSYFSYKFLNVNLGVQNISETGTFKSNFIESIILIPIIETVIFQYFLIVFFIKNVISNPKNNDFILLGVLSALLFSLVHIYSISYMIVGFLMGLYFSYITILSCSLREKKINIFISIFLTHLFINLTALMC